MRGLWSPGSLARIRRAQSPSFGVSILLAFPQFCLWPCCQESLWVLPTPAPASPPSLTLPPPGAPHSASSPAWAGPRPEGLHQRSCSISSADQWSEAAALPPGTLERLSQRRASRGGRAGERARGALQGCCGVCALQGRFPPGGPGGGRLAPCFPWALPAAGARDPPSAALPAHGCPQAALVAPASPSAPCAASSSASPRGTGSGWGGRRLRALNTRGDGVRELSFPRRLLGFGPRLEPLPVPSPPLLPCSSRCRWPCSPPRFSRLFQKHLPASSPFAPNPSAGLEPKGKWAQLCPPFLLG